MKQKVFLLSTLLASLLCACVGGTLSDTKEFEEYMLRGATPAEGKKLEHCLRAVRDEQKRHLRKHKRYSGRAAELPIDEACSGIAVALRAFAKGYNVAVQMHGEESTVRWTMDQDGTITEHTDEDVNEDWEF